MCSIVFYFRYKLPANLKKLRMRYFNLAFLLLLLLLSSCKKHEPSGIYDNGRIEYRISYLENNHSQISTNLLPKKMRLEFNQEYSVNIIEGFMGVFRLNNITYFKHKKCSTLLEVFNKNFVYLGRRGDEMCCFEEMDNMDVRETNETKTIAGLKCYKAIVTIKKNNEVFDIYYTKDIRLANPNVTNPYKKVNGVLVEFQLSMSGLKMRFEANKFESFNHNSMKEPVLPKNSSNVTRDQMAVILNRLLD